MMSKAASLRQAIAISSFRLFPPTIRESLLSRETFRHQYDIGIDAQIDIGNGIASFRRSELFSALRELHAGAVGSIEIRAVDGSAFTAVLEEHGSEKGVTLKAADRSIRIAPFWFLSPDSAYRLRVFDEEVQTGGLWGEEITAWRNRLATGPLTDDEVEYLTDTLKLTPQKVAQEIGGEVRTGTSQISVLVPRNEKYYERMAGRVGENQRLEDFVQGPCTAHIAGLLGWNFRAGLAQALLVSAHSSVTDAIHIDEEVREAVLVDFYDWLADRGDRFSQVAGIELGLGLAVRYPGIKPALIRMVKAILADDSGDQGGRLKLSASLVIFVDGELARTGTLRSKPPFFRRMSAIAQASLIERELLAVGVDSGQFAEWATGGRGQIFFLQTLADLRLEPRWLPDFMNPHQLKMEFIGRIVGAGQKIAPVIEEGELRTLVVEDGPGSARAALDIPQGFLPGPLEGGTRSPVAFPDELAAELRAPAAHQVLSERSLAAIVNMALIFRIESDHAQVVTDALRRAKHQISIGSDSDHIYSLLVGLAMVAAVTRAPQLAEEVRILARFQRRRPGVKIAADSLMRIGLISSASETDLQKWCAAVGEWFTEIAYEEIDPDQARAMRSHVRRLCGLVPQLWKSCGKGEAAFAAVEGTGL
jgi:hypothetical protein